ncbi:hypothetical protein V6582_10350 [Agrobacterium vitis]|uniref:hypothetical protein n=1 Tax=Agrobacterium vitis TaxID=373 RepID=UPI0012E80872|nr:hypothetical protein [Agrobacterium vitis]MVA24044.1 hypothetical protein [Agrobacterium vitis]
MNTSIPSLLAKETFEAMPKTDRIQAVLSIVDEAEYKAVTTRWGQDQTHCRYSLIPCF